MTNFETKFPGLRWMLAATAAICVIAGIWGVVSAVSLGSGFAEMTAAANPLVCLLGVLGVVYLSVAAACAVACVLLLMWLAYGAFLLIRYFVRRRRDSGH